MSPLGRLALVVDLPTRDDLTSYISSERAAHAQRIRHAVATMHRRVTGPGYSADDPALQV